MFGTDVADQFLNDDGLADSGAAVGSDLTAAGKRRNQIEYLDTRLENIDGGGLFLERRGLPMNGPVVLGFDLFEFIECLP